MSQPRTEKWIAKSCLRFAESILAKHPLVFGSVVLTLLIYSVARLWLLWLVLAATTALFFDLREFLQTI